MNKYQFGRPFPLLIGCNRRADAPQVPKTHPPIHSARSQTTAIERVPSESSHRLRMTSHHVQWMREVAIIPQTNRSIPSSGGEEKSLHRIHRNTKQRFVSFQNTRLRLLSEIALIDTSRHVAAEDERRVGRVPANRLCSERAKTTYSDNRLLIGRELNDWRLVVVQRVPDTHFPVIASGGDITLVDDRPVQGRGRRPTILETRQGVHERVHGTGGLCPQIEYVQSASGT